MANEEHLKILNQGVEVWNKWRGDNPDIEPDLSEAILADMNLFGVNFSRANLSGAYLRKVDLSGANLYGANLAGAVLSNAYLGMANLTKADLKEANLFGIYLCGADLTQAILKGADLREANLRKVNFNEADLSETKLEMANLIETRLTGTNISNSRIYGISAWNLKLKGTKQENLIISQENEPVITVDNLEVAQFIYLLLNNEKIRQVIDTITSKVVLILGRFTEARKVVLEAIRNELRKRDYLPVLFDFDKPASQDLTETISTLAHMARFIIADITEPKSVPHELATIVPTLSVPVRPIMLKGSKGEYAMFRDLRQKYHWVLAVHRYKNSAELVDFLEPKVIVPAEKKAKALIKRKSR